MLLSYAVAAQLICAFVFAYAIILFSHDTAHYVELHPQNHEMYDLDTCIFISFDTFK